MNQDMKQPAVLLDRSDVRVSHETGIAATIRSNIRASMP